MQRIVTPASLSRHRSGRRLLQRVFRLAFVTRRPERFFGTFIRAALASDNPIAIACLRLVTFRPERPLFKVPALRFFVARPTEAEAFLEYLRTMMGSPCSGKLIGANGDGSRSPGIHAPAQQWG
jgi:hypothetical protein